jgi:signal transduction histidine kinase
MSPNEMRQVFQPFFRAFRLRAASGTGLGLSIVKRIVEASGGTVRVQSILDQGTTFVIVLPLAEPVRV